MKTLFEYKSEEFSDAEDPAMLINLWHRKYLGLLSAFHISGSEVKMYRTASYSHDYIRPHSSHRPNRSPYPSIFYQASHDFIFPKQETPLVESDSIRILPLSLNDTGKRQDYATRDYSRSRVHGLLRIHYSDAESKVTFAVYDLLRGGSEIGATACKKLDQLEEARDRAQS